MVAFLHARKLGSQWTAFPVLRREPAWAISVPSPKSNRDRSRMRAARRPHHPNRRDAAEAGPGLRKHLWCCHCLMRNRETDHRNLSRAPSPPPRAQSYSGWLSERTSYVRPHAASCACGYQTICRSSLCGSDKFEKSPARWVGIIRRLKSRALWMMAGFAARVCSGRGAGRHAALFPDIQVQC